MKALALLFQLKNPSRSIFLQSFSFFSSSLAAKARFPYSPSDDEDGSTVYKQALKFQRPTTIKYDKRFENSVSLIGTVLRPIQVVKLRNGPFGVYTKLGVNTGIRSNHLLWITLKMWGEIAELAFNHLKENDFIYVSGSLCSDKMADDNGFNRLHHEVVVQEMNYVTRERGSNQERKSEEPHSDVGETYLEKKNNRLHLWQVFFSNPCEWWDRRKRKKNPKWPDFVHKDTGESLWLNSNDPPWIAKQLELMDSRTVEQWKGKQIGLQSYISKYYE